MSTRPRVIITDFVAGPLETERRVLGEVADVIALDASSEDEIVGQIEEADAIMMYHTVSITAKTIDRLKHCKLIVRCGVGYDNVDWRLARQRGIDVANVPDYGTEEVADSAIGMALALARGVTLFNSLLRDDGGEREWIYKLATPVHRLRGRVFGIIGLGRIGTASALRARRWAWRWCSTTRTSRTGVTSRWGCAGRKRWKPCSPRRMFSARIAR
jgi:D-3-phosphoglycerate dehydrogenase/C-terminal binding protein